MSDMEKVLPVQPLPHLPSTAQLTTEEALLLFHQLILAPNSSFNQAV
ncbi:hypothetical protein J2R91_001237 [Bradyrhizobium japonicum]|nr:hypothetical protein [Bradyrhizobium japonicum]